MIRRKISVIIPFLNPGEKLKKAIESLATDNTSDLEIIIWNDGSNDDFDYQSLSASYSHVIYKSDENRGVSEARNRASKLAGGKYLLFLDADDWMEPNAISLFLDLIGRDSALDLVFSWSRIHDLKSNKTEEWKKYQQMVFVGKSIAFTNLAGTFLIKKEIFDQVGGYNSSLRFSENLDLLIRVLSLRNLNIFYLKEITVNFGNSLDQITRNGKFSQKVLLNSLINFLESNSSFFEENKRFAANILCRIIVASIFLGKKESVNWYLQKLKEWGSPRYSKFYWLSRISPIYRMYLSQKGFRA